MKRPKRDGYLLVVCKNCGAPLIELSYSRRKLKAEVHWSREQGPPPLPRVLEKHFNGICPYCGAKLSPRPLELRVVPLNKVKLERCSGDEC